ncbi:hypothetical protein ACOME3_000014 [Neoechinorhynchus agilis]
MREATGHYKSKTFLIQKINMTVKRGNAASIMDTRPLAAVSWAVIVATSISYIVDHCDMIAAFKISSSDLKSSEYLVSIRRQKPFKETVASSHLAHPTLQIIQKLISESRWVHFGVLSGNN